MECEIETFRIAEGDRVYDGGRKVQGIETDDEQEGLELFNRTLKGLFKEAAVAMKEVDNLIIEVLASNRLEDCFGKYTVPGLQMNP